MSDFPDPRRRDAAPASGNMESGQKTILDMQWLEPPVSAQASYQAEGLVKRGVLTNMAPLGTLPRLGVFRKAHANGGGGSSSSSNNNNNNNNNNNHINDFAASSSRSKIILKRPSSSAAQPAAPSLTTTTSPPGLPTGPSTGPIEATPTPMSVAMSMPVSMQTASTPMSMPMSMSMSMSAAAAPKAATPPLSQREPVSPISSAPRSALPHAPSARAPHTPSAATSPTSAASARAPAAAPAAPSPPNLPPEDDTETEEEEEDPHDGDDESEAVNRHGRITILPPPRSLGRRSLPTSRTPLTGRGPLPTSRPLPNSRVMPEVTNWSSNGPTMPSPAQFVPRVHGQQQDDYPATPLEARQRVPFCREVLCEIVDKAVDEALNHFRFPTAFALRTLWDDFQRNDFIALMIYRVSTQTADQRTVDEFSRLLNARKKQGQHQHCAYMYFGGDALKMPPAPIPGSYSDRLEIDFSHLHGARRETRRPCEDPALAPRHEQKPPEKRLSQPVPMEMMMQEYPAGMLAQKFAQEAPPQENMLREFAPEPSQDADWDPSQAPPIQDSRQAGHVSGGEMLRMVLDPMSENEPDMKMDGGDLSTFLPDEEAKPTQPESNPMDQEEEIEPAPADKRASPVQDHKPAPEAPEAPKALEAPEEPEEPEAPEAPEEPAEPAEPTEPTEAAELSDHLTTTEPAESAQPIEAAGSAESVLKPVQIVESAVGPDMPVALATTAAPAEAAVANPPPSQEAEPAPPANPAPPKREIQFANAHRGPPPETSPRRLRKKRRSGRMSGSKAAPPTKRHTRAHSAASTLSSLSSVRSPSPGPALKDIEEKENPKASEQKAGAREESQNAKNEEADSAEEVARDEAPANASSSSARTTTPAAESKTSGSTRVVGNKAPPAAAVAAPTATQSQPIALRKRRRQHKRQLTSRQSKASPAAEPSSSHAESQAEAPPTPAVAEEEEEEEEEEKEQTYDMPAVVDAPLAPLFPHLGTGKKRASNAGIVFPSKLGKIDESDPKLRLRQSARRVTNLDGAAPAESFTREPLVMRDLPRLDFKLEPDTWQQQQHQQQQPQRQPETGPASRHHLRSSQPASRPTPNNLNLRSTRSSRKRSHDELEQDTGGQASPVAASFPASDAPSTAANSRAGTPAMRAAKRPKTGMRVKTSPMKKKTGTSAGVPRASGDRSSPVGNGGIHQDSNDDYCSTCGGNGDLICCDGCTCAFHYICLDPPLRGDQESMSSDWFCSVCEARRNPARLPHHSGPLCQMQERLDTIISGAFRLPADVRGYFDSVRTGVDGEYEEGVLVTKHTKRRKHEEEQVPDLLRLRDAEGNGIACHLCHRGSDGHRPVVPCSLCGLHWHLDCLDPPLANPPHLRTWRCPCHIDDLLARLPGVMAPAHRRRRIKGAPTIKPAFSRGNINNGYIDIDLDPPEDRSGSMDITTYGRTVRLPERSIKLDFLSRARVNRKGKPIPPIGVLSRPASASPVPNQQGSNTLLDRQTLDHHQAAHNLVQLSGQAPASGITTLLDAMLAQADESVISLMAQGNPDRLGSDRDHLDHLDQQSLRAMLAQMDAMRTRIHDKLSNPPPTTATATSATTTTITTSTHDNAAQTASPPLPSSLGISDGETNSDGEVCPETEKRRGRRRASALQAKAEEVKMQTLGMLIGAKAPANLSAFPQTEAALMIDEGERQEKKKRKIEMQREEWGKMEKKETAPADDGAMDLD